MKMLQNGPQFGVVIVGGYVFVYTAFSAVKWLKPCQPSWDNSRAVGC